MDKQKRIEIGRLLKETEEMIKQAIEIRKKAEEMVKSEKDYHDTLLNSDGKSWRTEKSENVIENLTYLDGKLHDAIEALSTAHDHFDLALDE